MRESLWREPRWNAGRRARDASRAPQRKLRRMVLSVFGVPLPFLFDDFLFDDSDGHDRDESRCHRRPSLDEGLLGGRNANGEWRIANSE